MRSKDETLVSLSSVLREVVTTASRARLVMANCIAEVAIAKESC